MTEDVRRPANLRIERLHRTGRPDLALVGELDIATVPILHHAIGRLIRDGHRTVRLDLSRLTFCDSTGVAGLVAAHTALDHLDGVLTATDLRGGPRWVTEMMGVLAILDPTDHPPRT